MVVQCLNKEYNKKGIGAKEFPQQIVIKRKRKKNKNPIRGYDMEISEPSFAYRGQSGYSVWVGGCRELIHYSNLV